MNHKKTNKCFCTHKFTGVFCEHKAKTENFLFLHQRQSFGFGYDGSFIGNTDSIIDENIFVYNSCSTVLNGEIIIFGGQDSRQVIIENNRFLIIIHLFNSIIDVER